MTTLVRVPNILKNKHHKSLQNSMKRLKKQKKTEKLFFETKQKSFDVVRFPHEKHLNF